MSDIVNKALANLLAGQHQRNQAVNHLGQTVNHLGQTVEQLARTVNEMGQTVNEMGQTVQQLVGQGDTQVVLIQDLIDAMETQSANSVPLRQKVAELESRLEQVERKVS